MRDFINLVEQAQLTLGDLVEVRTNFEDADFWLIRRGSEKEVGRPVKEYDKERFGIKVVRTEVLDANYLYYVMMHLHAQGVWKQIATGTTRLVSIKTKDVLSIPIG